MSVFKHLQLCGLMCKQFYTLKVDLSKKVARVDFTTKSAQGGKSGGNLTALKSGIRGSEQSMENVHSRDIVTNKRNQSLVA